jgi:catalase
MKVSMSEKNTLTTAAGIPVGDNQNALSAGRRGPLLVQDWQLFEKHAHFNHERITSVSSTPKAPAPTAR